MSNLLVTCGGRWVGLVLQLKQAMRQVPILREGQLLVADRSELTPAGCFADIAVKVPDVGHADYVERLLDLCLRHDVRVLVPHLDIDLDRLGPELGKFEAVGTTVVCPPADLVDLCRDKRRFDAFARQEGLACPRSFSAESLRDELFPLFAKPRLGTGSVGARVCRSLAEAGAALQQSLDLVFQELVVGMEATIDAYISRTGRCTVRVPRIRDRVTDGEAVQTTTVRSPALAALADRTVAALARRGLRGPLNVQMFTASEPILIEVNTRLGSGSVLGNMATGGRYFASILQEACGMTCQGEPDDYQEGLQLYRYWGEVYHKGNHTLALLPSLGEST